ncbi:hypothetical protein SAMN00808754_1660 [Thermanaeromonas toyohensis ToBE]|uniref:Uncharacterized protein n=1 Tax=Thermanaeromonas toyohensis ToBE TaxID=698762 RepID=A0A1W1VTW8_9FIRM|nr:hypothetical protein [Thermanaeromonas toyohensis]SMB96805.1 hypothetical protein SAMN00808754_1660 [Thermanaeromonas toyohensis ToBE]
MADSIRRVLLGQVAVDSGHLLIMDPLYISRLEEAARGTGKTVSEVALDIAYRCASGKHLGGQVNFPNGVSGMAVAFQSGIGDGVYPVIGHVKNLRGWGERLIRVEIGLGHVLM